MSKNALNRTEQRGVDGGEGFVGRCYVTQHAVDGYLQRIGQGRRADIRRRIAECVSYGASAYQSMSRGAWRAVVLANGDHPPFVAIVRPDTEGRKPAVVSVYAMDLAGMGLGGHRLNTSGLVRDDWPFK